MKTRIAGFAAVAAVAALSLAACSSTPAGDKKADTQSKAPDTSAPAADAGFPADSTVGVSLPWLGTQNWAEAQTMFEKELKDAGFKPIVQAADNKVPQQQQQIESMIEGGAKVLVVGPIDGKQLGTVLEKAKADGIYVIGYDRMIENTAAVDGVVQFGSKETGRLQGQALLDGLKAQKGAGPYNVEIFAGGPSDPNAKLFYDGAMEVLQPKIDDKTLVVVSGQTDFQQVATADWDNSKAQSRMDSILGANYSDKQLDGALAPNDGIARAIITSAENAGQPLPVTSGLDAENESIAWIAQGRQFCTIAKPTDQLVGKTMEIIKSLQAGKGMPEASETANNGVKDVPVYALKPSVVTKENLVEFFANDPERTKLIKDNMK